MTAELAPYVQNDAQPEQLRFVTATEQLARQQGRIALTNFIDAHVGDASYLKRVKDGSPELAGYPRHTEVECSGFTVDGTLLHVRRSQVAEADPSEQYLVITGKLDGEVTFWELDEPVYRQSGVGHEIVLMKRGFSGMPDEVRPQVVFTNRGYWVRASLNGNCLQATDIEGLARSVPALLAVPTQRAAEKSL